MAALVQGYPQQSGTVTVLQTRPSSAHGMLQSVPVSSAAQYLPSSSQRHNVHGLPATVTAPVVYRGGSGSLQQYALRSMPNFAPAPQWQQSRTQRTTSSPAVPTIQTLDYLQPALARSRYAASVSMTNLPSTANHGLQTGVGTRDDSALPASGSRRSAAAPRSPRLNNGAPSQPSLAATAPVRAAPERYRRSALRSSDSANLAPQGPTGNSQLRPLHSALLNRPNSFVGSVSGSAIDDTGVAVNFSPDEVKRVRRRSMPALDSPGFPLHLTPHDLGQPAEVVRPKSADRDDKAVKTGHDQPADKSGNDGQPGNERSAAPSARPSAVSTRAWDSPKSAARLHCPIITYCALSLAVGLLTPSFSSSHLVRQP